MAMKNTIVIKSNQYKREVKYFWKNGDGTLSDLAEISSPFSKAKQDYERLTNTKLANIADSVVNLINEEYNSQDGVDIEVEGSEADYMAVKMVIETKFEDKHIDCKWIKRLDTVPEEILEKTLEKTLSDIKGVFRELARALDVYDQKKVIKLCEENDRRGWLRYGFTWKHITDASVRDIMHELTGYLDNIIKEIRTEKVNSMKTVEKLEQEWKQERERAAEIGKIIADKELKELIGKICKKEKRDFEKQFKDMLNEFCKKKLPNDEQIADHIKDIEQYAYQHKEEYKDHYIGNIGGCGNEKADAAFAMLRDEMNRTEYIRESLVRDFNEELQRYVVELNKESRDFIDGQREELKRKIMEQVYGSDKFTQLQKEVIRQYIMSYGNVCLSYCAIKPGDRIEEKEFHWMKKGLGSPLYEKEKKSICGEYEDKLKDKFKDKNKAILKENDKIFDNMGDKILKNLKVDTESSQMQKRLNEDKERKDGLIRLEKKFVDGKNKIEAMVSF